MVEYIKNKLLKNNTVKEAYVYLVTSITYSAIPFILLPVLTRYLSQEEYGEVTMFYTLVSALGAIVGVNSHSFSGRKFYEAENKIEIQYYNSACISIFFISIVFVLISVLIFGDIISKYFGLSNAQIYFAVITSGGMFIVNFRLIQWQIRKKPKLFGYYQISHAIINLVLTLILVIIYKYGADGRIYAYVVSSMVFGSMGTYLLFKDNLLAYKIPQLSAIREGLSFGLPLVFHVGGNFFLNAGDRVIINANMSMDSVGVYYVAVQFSLIFSIIFSAVNKAYMPWLFEKLNQNEYNTKLRIVRYTYYYFGVLALLILVSYFIIPPFLKFVVDEKFYEASTIVIYLVIGQCFNGAYLMITNYLFYAKRTGFLATVTITTGSLNLLLLYILTNKLGLFGAAISFLIAMGLRFILTFYFSNKFFPMPWYKGIINFSK